DHLLMPDRPDYRYEMDARGHIAAIRCEHKNRVHRIVEECMVATNRSAADFLRDDEALFVVHNGFRPERLENVRRLTGERLPELAEVDPTSAQGYLQLIQAA